MPVTINGNGTMTGVNPATSGFGKILQVQSTNRTDSTSQSVAGNGAESGDLLSVTITPTSATSKIMVMATVNVAGSEAGIFTLLYRGSTKIFLGDAASARQRVGSSTRNSEPATPEQVAMFVLDSPGTTSATTYAIRVSHQASTTQTVYLNRGVADSDTAATPRSASSITVMEVAP